MRVGDVVRVKNDCIFSALQGEDVLITTVKQYTVLVITKNGGKYCLFMDEVEEINAQDESGTSEDRVEIGTWGSREVRPLHLPPTQGSTDGG